ncbi:RsmB/NOP family class I SAM-dependent RNA methyltransferase [Lacibacterium aquatile]|uniref:RsmB/NOP family class I SAM-dependent RNA methyltransferase n=1 Tax=Lacibacterium aquatile TaxID=1168082 RepID=A0ABW5DU27_9PROT
MKPGARLQAVAELLEDIASGGVADAAASRYFRERRYIGSKDRSSVAERLFAILRRRARLDWWVNRILERSPDSPPPAARHRLIADLILVDNWGMQKFLDSFDGEKHHPAPLSRAEKTLIEKLADQPLDHPEMPRWVRFEVPEWAEGKLTELFENDDAELAALNENAPLDLRTNRLKCDRDAAMEALKEQGLTVEAAPWSPLAIRVEGRPALGNLPAFHEGIVEVQDEGSQLVALLADAKPGQWVMDYCAGAGGKTLALAAEMENKGRLVASDISAKRLMRAVERLRRAGVHNAERRPLDGEHAQWFKRQAGKFDRVVVDAPCSGTGTWRRNPDMKWKIGPEDIAELQVKQREIIAAASKLVKTGGRLVYATCSILPEENEQTIAGFLADHPDFQVVPVTKIWAERIGTECPVEGDFLRLSPKKHGTDGFFTAVLEKKPQTSTT